MRFGIVVFPGSNCDWDCHHVLTEVLGQNARFVWHKESTLPPVDCVIVPGGFSYGDYLRSGSMAAFSPIMSEVKKFSEQGGLVIGICNGFQILTEARLLPGALMRNQGLQFICENTALKVESIDSVFTRKYQVGEQVCFPIAHHDGNYFADEETLKRIEGEGQVLFRYVNNPNGSVHDIAGLRNGKKNVMGLMPHPERAADIRLGTSEGLRLFQSLLEG